MRKLKPALVGVLLACLAAGLYVFLKREAAPEPPPDGLIGSASCRSCHEKFYELWAPSFHGLALQPFTVELARAELTPQTRDTVIGDYRYRAEIGDKQGWVLENGPDGEKKYPIVHVMGGKNVYYFLTPMERGRLQVVPVAYDVRRQEWYDTAASAVRHFPDQPDEALNWRERPYTFNTSCYGCHVSQLTTNYNLETDTYRTMWAEPGINCETCHGPCAGHVRVCEEAPEDSPPEDLEIIVTSKFSAEQTNTMCAPCHAKMVPLSTDFRPGDRYFDHYGLVTFEDPDFYPDGRDLGENYTFTLWRTSPCAKSGKLDCSHCHTSSGRYRFKGDEANNACAPCHQDKVSNPPAHTRHLADSPGSECVSCHMPMTEFARMRRSDHSMRPPTPAATIAYKSPNACNLCHADHDAEWADKWVRQWRTRDYQAPVLRRAALIDAARKQDWSRLKDILAYLRSKDHDEVYANSLIRLLRRCEDEAKWPVILESLEDPSPLVRASATEALSAHLTPEVISALANATRDEYRLVRIRSAAALARVPREMLSGLDRPDVDRAVAEFEAAMRSRPDDAASHSNLGNFHMNRGELERAVDSFETAVRLNPESVATLVNASLAYNLMGRNDKAEQSLRNALEVDPGNAAANFNLGLLLGEQGRLREAKQALREALDSEPDMAAAAYNLGVLSAEDSSREAIRWCRKAAELRPQEPKYAYTLAFYQRQNGDVNGAIKVLGDLVKRHPSYTDGYMLLGHTHEAEGDPRAAASVYRRALKNEELSPQERRAIEARLRAVAR